MIEYCFHRKYHYYRKTAEYAVISSFVKKPAQNREKSTNGDY